MIRINLKISVSSFLIVNLITSNLRMGSLIFSDFELDDCSDYTVLTLLADADDPLLTSLA